MPGKSRSRKGKYSSPIKKRKGRSSHSTTLVRQPAANQTHQPVSSPKVPVTSASVSIPMAKSAASQYRYVATELRTIGILVGIMLVILFVLARVLA